MLANAAAPAILTRVLDSAMLANATAPALLAITPSSAMLANAAAPAFLADAPLSTMLAKLSKTLSRFRLSRHSNRIYRMSNTIFIATCGAVLLAHRSSRRVSQPLPTTYAATGSEGGAVTCAAAAVAPCLPSAVAAMQEDADGCIHI